jgi:hypothetical protein
MTKKFKPSPWFPYFKLDLGVDFGNYHDNVEIFGDYEFDHTWRTIKFKGYEIAKFCDKIEFENEIIDIKRCYM